jgi:hypothetical protein
MCQNKNQENLFNDLAKQFSGILADALLDRLKPEIQKLINHQPFVPQPTPQLNKPGSSDKSKTLWTINDLAADSGLSPATWRSWVYQRKIPVVRMGRSVRVRESDYRKLIQDSLTPEFDWDKFRDRLK